MGVKDLGEFKFSAIEQSNAQGLLHSTVKERLKADPKPDWAAVRVIEACNVPKL